jgi:predicted aspartyl protease
MQLAKLFVYRRVHFLSVSVYLDEKDTNMAASLNDTDKHTLEMLFNGKVAGTSAKVGLSEANILVDTGATGPFMSPKLAARLKLRVNRSPAAVTLADGTTVYSAGTCHAKLSLGKFSCRVKFVVAPLADQFDVVLGDSWLKSRKASINYGDGSLTLFKGRNKFVVTKTDQTQQATNVAEEPQPSESSHDSNVNRVNSMCFNQPVHRISAMQAKRAIRNKLRHFAVVVTKQNSSAE